MEFGFLLCKSIDKVRKCASGIDNILHDQDILSLKRLVQIFDDLYNAGGLCAAAVAGHGHKGPV